MLLCPYLDPSRFNLHVTNRILGPGPRECPPCGRVHEHAVRSAFVLGIYGRGPVIRRVVENSGYRSLNFNPLR